MKLLRMTDPSFGGDIVTNNDNAGNLKNKEMDYKNLDEIELKNLMEIEIDKRDDIDNQILIYGKISGDDWVLKATKALNATKRRLFFLRRCLNKITQRATKTKSEIKKENIERAKQLIVDSIERKEKKKYDHLINTINEDKKFRSIARKMLDEDAYKMLADEYNRLNIVECEEVEVTL
ncbi:MAG: hypothetical protein SCH10_02865 [Nitrosomonadaceae bacterium]|nr:hypothetical protein [Nitrosomonadaceae bacterium]